MLDLLRNEAQDSSVNKPWEIKDKRVLCIFDAHQQIEWVKAILKREAGNFDHFIYGGDMVDSFDGPPKVASITETAHFMKDILDGKYGPSTYIIGNHCLGPMEAHYQINKGYTIKSLRNACSGYTNNKAQKINDVLSWEDWRKMKIFVTANGYLVSHAGFRENNWRPFANVDGNLQALWKECDEALELIAFKPHHMFTIGMSRGGASEWGGPLWLDHSEFRDNLPLPQIYGHSQHHNSVRQIGRSYCIDGGQTTYCIVRPDGKVEFKSMRFSTFDKKWIEQAPKFVNDDERVAKRKAYMTQYEGKPIKEFTY